MRLVLDTNVWLDWLVFDDPAVRALKAAFHAGKIQIVINPACVEELRGVLAYPAFKLAVSRQHELVAEVLSCTCATVTRRMLPLPRCTDVEDQKFLELACDARADWLLTKDKALRRLGTKTPLAAGFQVGTPQQWLAASGTPDHDQSRNVTASATGALAVR